jgi:hypothetical protein
VVSHRNRCIPAANRFVGLWHTANLLPDGNVMMVGGWRGDRFPSARIDLFESGAGRFHDAGRLRVARQYHRTVNLPGGHLLVTGGNAWRMALPSAEIIHPCSGRVEDAGAPVEGRSEHTATLLRDGRVLLVGGLGASGEGPSGVSATAEIWEPETGEFRLAAGTPAVSRVGHGAALLPDGRVLVAGGWTAGTRYVLAEIFHPATEEFSTVSCPDNRARKGHTTLQLKDGSVLVLGGDVLGEGPAGGWRPDASVLHFFADGTGAEVLVALAEPRSLAPGAIGPDGRAWVFGGMSGWQVSARAEAYEAGQGSRCIESLPAPRCNHTVTHLADGKFLLAGGENEWAELMPEALIYE